MRFSQIIILAMAYLSNQRFLFIDFTYKIGRYEWSVLIQIPSGKERLKNLRINSARDHWELKSKMIWLDSFSRRNYFCRTVNNSRFFLRIVASRTLSYVWGPRCDPEDLISCVRRAWSEYLSPIYYILYVLGRCNHTSPHRSQK